MNTALSTLDMVIFFGSLLVVMAVGLWAGRKEKDATDFYLAGKTTRWWGVAGSVFGSNVSANHIVGMMGVGFAAGFAQSHFEVTAIAGLLVLCYAFLPMYRKLNVFTLSEYLSRRYDDKSRIAYALIMVVIMVVIQMVPGFYIGSRSINLLLEDTGERATATAAIDEAGAVSHVRLHGGGAMYEQAPEVDIAPPAADGEPATGQAVIAEKPVSVIVVTEPGSGYDPAAPPVVTVEGPAEAEADVTPDGQIADILVTYGGENYDESPIVAIAPPPGEDGTPAEAFADIAPASAVTAVEITEGGSGYDAENPPGVAMRGGAEFDAGYNPGDVRPSWYIIGIILMALVTGTYTIIGGLKAVIVTDVIQSLLLLIAGLMVAFLTFSQPEVGGWAGMAARDAADAQKLHLYLPTDHASLPWTGVLSGLMVLHFFYWGANQFVVQRALSARSDREAKLGVIVAGFAKLLIPFFSIGTGIAAFYLFRQRGLAVDQDAVFTRLLTDLVQPIGFGLVGVIAAGMIGAILSSLDSMMNSAATIFTFDIYRRYINPDAPEQRLVLIGRICIVIFIIGAAALTIFSMDPNSDESFFLHIANHQGRLIAGVVVAFFLGMLWPRATAAGAIVSIVSGVAFSYGLPPLYNSYLGTIPAVADVFGEQLNFLHTVFIAAMICLVLHVTVSLLSKPDSEKAKLTWTGQGVHSGQTLWRFAGAGSLTLIAYAVLAVLMVNAIISPAAAAWAAAVGTFLVIAVPTLMKHYAERNQVVGVVPQAGGETAVADATGEGNAPAPNLWLDDRMWAALLAASAVFIMFYFY